MSSICRTNSPVDEIQPVVRQRVTYSSSRSPSDGSDSGIMGVLALRVAVPGRIGVGDQARPNGVRHLADAVAESHPGHEPEGGDALEGNPVVPRVLRPLHIPETNRDLLGDRFRDRAFLIVL